MNEKEPHKESGTLPKSGQLDSLVLGECPCFPTSIPEEGGGVQMTRA